MFSLSEYCWYSMSNRLLSDLTQRPPPQKKNPKHKWWEKAKAAYQKSWKPQQNSPTRVRLFTNPVVYLHGCQAERNNTRSKCKAAEVNSWKSDAEKSCACMQQRVCTWTAVNASCFSGGRSLEAAQTIAEECWSEFFPHESSSRSYAQRSLDQSRLLQIFTSSLYFESLVNIF